MHDIVGWKVECKIWLQDLNIKSKLYIAFWSLMTSAKLKKVLSTISSHSLLKMMTSYLQWPKSIIFFSYRNILKIKFSSIKFQSDSPTKKRHNLLQNCNSLYLSIQNEQELRGDRAFQLLHQQKHLDFIIWTIT